VDVAPVALVVDQREDVQALEDPSVVVNRLPERGRVSVALQDPGDVVGAHGAGVDRGDHAQDVRPVTMDLCEVKPAAPR
jgi:hypothetical protein